MQEQKLLEERTKALNIFAGISICIYTGAMAGAWWYDADLGIMTLFVFAGLGIGFLSVGLTMLIVLKRHFTSYYEKIGCKLIIATILLSVPMFIRAINWLGQLESTAYLTFYDNNIAYTNAVYAILTTMVPVVAQMSSLIFGVLKNQKDPNQKRQASYVT